MMDDTIQETFEWIDGQLKKYHETAGILEHEIQEYLKWMAGNAYSQTTRKNHKRLLGHFLSFVRSRRYLWDDIFTYETMMRFKKIKGFRVHPTKAYFVW